MHVVMDIGTYVIIWWLVIFMVLPFGVHPAEADDPAHGSGAPARTHLKLKAAVTTVIAAVIWLALYEAVAWHLIDFRGPSP